MSIKQSAIEAFEITRVIDYFSAHNVARLATGIGANAARYENLLRCDKRVECLATSAHRHLHRYLNASKEVLTSFRCWPVVQRHCNAYGLLHFC